MTAATRSFAWTFAAGICGGALLWMSGPGNLPAETKGTVAQPASAQENSAGAATQRKERLSALLAEWRQSGAISPAQHRRLRREVLEWLEDDPGSCLEWLAHTGMWSMHKDMVASWMAELARSSPAMALSVAARAEAPFQQSHLFGALIDEMVRSDPAALVGVIPQLPSHWRARATIDAAKSLVEKDVKFAFDSILNADLEVSQWVNLVVAGWAKKDPEAAFTFVVESVSEAEVIQRTQGRMMKRDLFHAALEEFRNRSPERCLNALLQTDVGFDATSMISEAADRCLVKQPERAEEILAKLPNENVRQRALFFAGLAAGADGAAQYASLIESGAMRSALFRRFARDEVYLGSPAAALAWSEKIEDPLGRAAAMKTTAEHALNAAPAFAIETTAADESGAREIFSTAVVQTMFDRFWKPGIEAPPELDWMRQLSEPAKQWLQKVRAEMLAEAAEASQE